MIFGFSALQQSMRFVDASDLFIVKNNKPYKFDKVLSPDIINSDLFDETKEYLHEIGVLYTQMQKREKTL